MLRFLSAPPSPVCPNRRRVAGTTPAATPRFQPETSALAREGGAKADLSWHRPSEVVRRESRRRRFVGSPVLGSPPIVVGGGEKSEPKKATEDTPIVGAEEVVGCQLVLPPPSPCLRPRCTSGTHPRPLEPVMLGRSSTGFALDLVATSGLRSNVRGDWEIAST